ncbi:hypothetical protein GS432_06545 [Rhodococcus hoagii]|nr:hypothetical protein [Prescottella equi]
MGTRTGTTADRETGLRAFCATDRPDYVFVDPAAAEFKVQLHEADGVAVARTVRRRTRTA